MVEGLRHADARELLDSVVRWPLDERVADRIVAETRGNPLALLELPRGRSPAELAGGFGLPEALPRPGRLPGRLPGPAAPGRIESLPEPTRLLLAVAAADPTGDPALVRGAAGCLGLGVEVAEQAEETGLLDIGGIGGQVVFRHPLMRPAAYRGVSRGVRRKVHAALAEVTDAQAAPDRRAWHLAQARSGPDEQVAAELERSAGRAQARGGMAAAADVSAEGTRWGWLGQAAASALWDDARWRAILVRQAQFARDAGALDQLPVDLGFLATDAVWRGDFAAAVLYVHVGASRTGRGRSTLRQQPACRRGA